MFNVAFAAHLDVGGAPWDKRAAPSWRTVRCIGQRGRYGLDGLCGDIKAPASLLDMLLKSLLCSRQAEPRSAFADWAAHYGRSYAADSAEYEARLGAWLHTLRHVLESPAHAAAEVPVNGFAAMSDDEFRAAYLGQVMPDAEEDEALLGCAAALHLPNKEAIRLIMEVALPAVHVDAL